MRLDDVAEAKSWSGLLGGANAFEEWQVKGDDPDVTEDEKEANRAKWEQMTSDWESEMDRKHAG